jgi:cbb3-type cytochrome oxidase maturation protein
MDITFYLFFVALLVSFAAWCIFLWAIRTGQFHDVEDTKYQIWQEPAGEPEREDAAKGTPVSVPRGWNSASR